MLDPQPDPCDDARTPSPACKETTVSVSMNIHATTPPSGRTERSIAQDVTL